MVAIKHVNSRDRLLLPLLLVILVSTSSCNSQPKPNMSPFQSTFGTPSTPTASPQMKTIPSPEAGRSNITGVLINGPDGEPVSSRKIYLLQINWDAEHQNGFYMLDEANSPSATSGTSGEFLFRSVEPRDYVLYAGYLGEDVLNGDILDDKNDPSRKWILQVEPNKTLDLGSIWFAR
jgi:hypothetical protein